MSDFFSLLFPKYNYTSKACVDLVKDIRKQVVETEDVDLVSFVDWTANLGTAFILNHHIMVINP